MKSSRLESRIDRELGEAQRAVLHGYKLAFNKVASSDGSGRANIVQAKNADVWGVLYALSKKELSLLDSFEGTKTGQYNRVPVDVELEDGTVATAQIYIAGDAFVQDGIKPVRVLVETKKPPVSRRWAFWEKWTE